MLHKQIISIHIVAEDLLYALRILLCKVSFSLSWSFYYSISNKIICYSQFRYEIYYFLNIEWLWNVSLLSLLLQFDLYLTVFFEICVLGSSEYFSRGRETLSEALVERSILGLAPEESEEISFRINITNSISRRVPMDHDSHRRWHPREMYGWHQHMHERRAAAVSVGRPLSIAFWLSCCGHC